MLIAEQEREEWKLVHLHALYCQVPFYRVKYWLIVRFGRYPDEYMSQRPRRIK